VHTYIQFSLVIEIFADIFWSFYIVQEYNF